MAIKEKNKVRGDQMRIRSVSTITMLLLTIFVLILPMSNCMQAPSCSSNFMTPSSDYDEVVNICNVDEATGKIEFTSNFLPPLQPGYRILLVSPNYGCGNYPQQEFKCNAILTTASIEQQQRIIQNLVYASLYRANSCNGGSDQLRLKSVVGGEGNQGKLTVCGQRRNLNVNATSAFSFVTFVSRGGNEDKGFELLIEGPPLCTTASQALSFFTPPSSYSSIFNLCGLNRDTSFTLSSGNAILLTSQDYGCYPYPHLPEREKCSLTISHSDPSKRLVYTISFMDLRRSPSNCNIYSDRLVFVNVEDGDPNNGFRQIFCGFRRNVVIRAKAGQSKIVFAAGLRFGNENEGKGFEVLLQAE